MPDSDNNHKITLRCKQCNALLRISLLDRPVTIPCPTCQTALNVPAAPREPNVAAKSPAKANAAKTGAQKTNAAKSGTVKTETVKTDEEEFYSLVPASTPDLPPKPAKKKPKKSWPTAPVRCSVCTYQAEVECQSTPSLIDCPRCGEQITVPAARGPLPAIPPKQKNAVRDPLDKTPENFLPTAPRSTAVPDTTVADRLAEHFKQPVDPPPKFLFFSHVWEFPFMRSVYARWLWVTLGIASIFFIGAFTVSVVFRLGNMAAAIAFFILPAMWIWILSSSYFSACFLTIIEDTSAGCWQIYNWPEPVWKDWFARFLYLSFILGVTGSLSYFISLVVAFTGIDKWVSTVGITGFLSHFVPFINAFAGVEAWISFVIAATFLFPLVLLSSMANVSWVDFISGKVLMSLFRLPRHWFLFYLLTTPVLAIVFFPPLYFPNWSVWLPLAWTPVIAGGLFVYARLLGRLAWYIVDSTTEPPSDSDESPASAVATPSDPDAQL